MDLLLEDKVVVITGGTKGIGLAITESFCKEGAKVIVGSRTRRNLDRNIDYYYLDVSNKQSCIDFFNYVIDKYKKIDVLVNNAGIMKDRSTKKMTDSEFDDVINTNLKGTFNMVRLIGPLMQNNGYGSIINISSCVVRFGNYGQANYVASKAGIEGMSKCWAKEFSSHGENVRVNVIAPGIVLTDIFKDTSLETINMFSKKTALGRLAKAEEIANIVLFLASEVSSYITGSIIHADGGGIDYWSK